MKLTSTDPSQSYKVVGEVEVSTTEEIKAKVEKAHKAKKTWRELGVKGRVELLRKVSTKFAESKQRFAELEAQEMGMPIKEAVDDFDFGLDLLEAQVQDAVDKGAKVVIGGKKPEGLEGAYYEPTLLTNVNKDMRIWQEEVFGPVLPIVPFKDEGQAIRMANDTKYGLGAYVFTADKDRFMRIAHQLESGMVSQNTLSYINVCNPFTGYKMSGGGREHAQFGFDEVTQIRLL